MRSRWQHGRRLWLAAAVAAVLAALGGSAWSAWAGNGPSAGASAKIASEVVDDLQQRGSADYWIVLCDDAGTGAARQIRDWDARGQRVVDTLQSAAKASQAHVRKVLDARGVKYRAFWITNAILVRGGTMTAANEVAALDGVAEIRAPQTYAVPEPVEAPKASAQADGVEWGVANIRADQVWERFGTRGEGIVVANIDSGVQYDHPALARAYRGNNGDGTFDHDYNWLDTSGICGGVPCDANRQSSHGTHTMGTIAGDGGAGNQIGVAPGARWIAANGCVQCFDFELIASAQWMLEPTDADGGNPDVGKRPHIINNSWGSRFPTNDPFMEDILGAWRDAGIFSTWANGNIGPNCFTSSSPGSRTITYSVGAYDVANAIAPFSSRGPGQGGGIKPNIAAPGVAIRSAQQGNFYGALSGTSMAAPHVAGAVALLWSAEPALVGDIEATRELLDLTAIDTANAQCGGTAEDNNVFGEGRLDALALVEAGSRGDAGTLTGTVTDGQTGAPVRNARIRVTGPIERETTTGADGTYTLAVVPGDYEVEITAFGYETGRRTAQVAADQSLTLNVALTPLETVTVTGSVLDGSGHGWPLYARIAVEGRPGSTFTNPSTGRYRLELPSNSTFKLRVTAQYPGYRVVEDVVETGVGTLRHDIEVPIDAQSCTAPGYDWAVTGTGSSFDDRTMPPGWSVRDNNGAGGLWTFDDPGNRGNRTGGSGGFANFDADYLPKFVRFDSTLMSPVADLSDVPAPALTFNTDYSPHSPGHATGEIDLSLDGGETWTNVWRRTSGGIFMQPVRVDLPQAAGQARARVRFRYTTINTGQWQIDDLVFGVERCAPRRGGLVLGQVVDGNTGAPLAGATVVSADAPGERATSAATPNDPALGDGFYWLFSSEVGGHDFTASRAAYQSDTREVNVPPHWTTQADFTLRAGRLAIEPATVSATQTLGQATTRAVTFTNTGTAPVDVTLREEGGDATPLGQAAGAPAQRIEGRFTPGRAGGFGFATAESTNAPFAPPWTAIGNYPTPIMDNAVVTADDGTVYSLGGTTTGGRTQNTLFAYDARTGTWSQKAAMGWEREAPAAAYIGGKVYVIGGWWTNGVPVDALEIYNPSTNSWSTGAPIPTAYAAPGVGVVGDTMYVVGGCERDICGVDDVFAYSPGTGRWRQVADYPEPVSFVSCGGIGDKLYCAGGAREGGTTNAAYVYDPASDAWAPVAAMPRDVWGAAHAAANGRLLISGGAVDGGTAITNEGLAYDPAADAWTAIPSSNDTVFRGGSSCGFYRVGGSIGGFSPIPRGEVLPGYGKCGAAAELPWLSADRTTFSLAPGERITVTLRFDAGVAAVSQPGTYSGRITVANNSPYGAALDATMVVRPPTSWGKIAGTVTGVRCDGTRIPLPGATIAIDGALAGYTVRTDADGKYGHWLDRRNNPVTLIVSLDGWRPQTRRVRITAGATTTADFALTSLTSCGGSG